MKTLQTYYKSTFLTKVVLLLFFVTVHMGCSKDDEPAQEETVKSSEKQITSFVFLLNDNPLQTDVVATIDEENKTIDATVPPDADVSNLLPEIKISKSASINKTTTQNFSEPISYIVTAEDGSTAIYTITVHFALSQRQVLQAILDANPSNTISWDLQNTVNLENLNGVTLNTEGEIMELDLPNKNLNELPAEIGQLKSLEILLLGENNLVSLPPEIGQLSKLKVLQLAVNQITELPDELWRINDLSELYVNSNRLSHISSEIGNLTKLRVLVLSSNQLTTIPSEIKELSSLIKFNLFDNSLTVIPKEIGELKNLTELFLLHNQLTELPIELGLLTNLNNLNLSNNKLTSVPTELGFLTGLNSLDLSNNDLVAVPHSLNYLKTFTAPTMDFLHDLITFQTNSQHDILVSIYTANPGNTLNWGVNNFPEIVFDDDGNPTVITINNKNLIRLPIEIGELTTLETLNVNENNLESLPATLANINTLNVITAANNNLSTVPSEFGLMTNLALLSLTNNPLTGIPQEVCDLQTSNGGILTILNDPNEGCN